MGLTPTEKLLVEPYYKYKEFLSDCSNKNYDSSLVLHKHHIIPKCIGGTNNRDNLILLSVIDHMNAHLLLANCFDEGSYEELSNLRSARLLNKKSIMDKDTLDRIANSYKGELNPFYGKSMSEESKKRLIATNRELRLGKTYEEIYGDGKAIAERRKRGDSAKVAYASLSDVAKLERSKKISEKLKGKPARNKGVGKGIKVNGIEFTSIKSAAAHFNTTPWFITRSKNTEFVVEFL